MFHLRDFHKLGRQALSVLSLHITNKTKSNSHQKEVKNATTDKRNTGGENTERSFLMVRI